MRPSTIQRLTVGQLRTAIKEQEPVLHVLAEQEKNRTEHYVPIAAPVAAAIKAVLEHDFGEKDDATPFFLFNSFEKWLERQRIPLPRVRDPAKAHLWLSDFRKFGEQFGDIIGWDETNRKYVMAHGMTGVEWEHYKHPAGKCLRCLHEELGKGQTLSVRSSNLWLIFQSLKLTLLVS